MKDLDQQVVTPDEITGNIVVKLSCHDTEVTLKDTEWQDCWSVVRTCPECGALFDVIPITDEALFMIGSYSTHSIDGGVLVFLNKKDEEI